jgi:hypothetical protein
VREDAVALGLRGRRSRDRGGESVVVMAFSWPDSAVASHRAVLVVGGAAFRRSLSGGQARSIGTDRRRAALRDPPLGGLGIGVRQRERAVKLAGKRSSAGRRRGDEGLAEDELWRVGVCRTAQGRGEMKAMSVAARAELSRNGRRRRLERSQSPAAAPCSLALQRGNAGSNDAVGAASGGGVTAVCRRCEGW